jgi:hypothetical protein
MTGTDGRRRHDRCGGRMLGVRPCAKIEAGSQWVTAPAGAAVSISVPPRPCGAATRS